MYYSQMNNGGGGMGMGMNGGYPQQNQFATQMQQPGGGMGGGFGGGFGGGMNSNMGGGQPMQQ